MITRFTFKVLEESLEPINDRLRDVTESSFSYKPQQRNGYTAVDLYQNGSCIRTIGTGTPKDCWTSVLEDYSATLYYAAIGFRAEVRGDI